MLFVPRYFDFVRVRELLAAEDVPFVAISECAADPSQTQPIYIPTLAQAADPAPSSQPRAVLRYSTAPQVSRARAALQAKEVPLLGYTERSHFFRRHRLRGARHLAVYSPPSYARIGTAESAVAVPKRSCPLV